MVIWLVGLSGAGKTVIGSAVYERWKTLAPNTVFADGDEIRALFNQTDPAAYTIQGRELNSQRIMALCRWLDRQSINVVCPILSIFEEHRRMNRELLTSYYEVFVDVPFDALRSRDTKGLYRNAASGVTQNVVGVDIPYTPPATPDFVVQNEPFVDLQLTAQLILERSGALR